MSIRNTNFSLIFSHALSERSQYFSTVLGTQVFSCNYHNSLHIPLRKRNLSLVSQGDVKLLVARGL